MRLRRWPAIIAVLGVLLHAAALIRHHGVMLDGYLDYQARLADAAAFCHGGADATPSSPANLPGLPKPLNDRGDCPVCSGQAPTFTLASPQSVDAPVRLVAKADWSEQARSPRTLPHPVCPPARGPPASALTA